MKRIICIISAVALLLACFNLSAFAEDDSYKQVYFNKLVEIRERPGLFRIILTGKDNNGYSTDTICYALNDYNQDGIPELIVYGTNIANEAGENYRVFTCKNGSLKEFDIIPHKGPEGEKADYASQPYWPCYTGFFALPEGYTSANSASLLWIIKNNPQKENFWAEASIHDIKETVLEVKFDFDKMTAEVIPVIYSEGVDAEKYAADLQSWKENHTLSVRCDEYGRKIPEDNEALWKQLSGSETEAPQLTIANRLLIFINSILGR